MGASGATWSSARVGDHPDVCFRERVPARLGALGHLLGGEHSRHRLLLKPLTDVPAINRGGIGERISGARAALPERVVEAEPVPQVDAIKLQGTDGGIYDSSARVVVRKSLVVMAPPSGSSSTCGREAPPPVARRHLPPLEVMNANGAR